MTRRPYLRRRLSKDLTSAMRARDTTRAEALRVVIAALENAEAPGSSIGAVDAIGSPFYAGAAAGLGSAEAPRRELDDAEVHRIVLAEIHELTAAASLYEGLDRQDEAERLRKQAEVLNAYLPESP